MIFFFYIFLNFKWLRWEIISISKGGNCYEEKQRKGKEKEYIER